MRPAPPAGSRSSAPSAKTSPSRPSDLHAIHSQTSYRYPAALALELSSLIASLAVGATMVNLSADSRKLFQTLARSDPPFYAIFFVIAGAGLNLALLKSIGILGAAYVVCRGVGKFAGSRLAARKAALRMFGPVSARLAIVRTGEARPRKAEAAGVESL